MEKRDLSTTITILALLIFLFHGLSIKITHGTGGANDEK